MVICSSLTEAGSFTALEALEKGAVGVIRTGMGDHGAHGMRELSEAGAFTIAQDEASCIVFGMPAEAIKLGGVKRILPLDQIAHEVMRLPIK